MPRFCGDKMLKLVVSSASRPRGGCPNLHFFSSVERSGVLSHVRGGLQSDFLRESSLRNLRIMEFLDVLFRKKAPLTVEIPSSEASSRIRVCRFLRCERETSARACVRPSEISLGSDRPFSGARFFVGPQPAALHTYTSSRARGRGARMACTNQRSSSQGWANDIAAIRKGISCRARSPRGVRVSPHFFLRSTTWIATLLRVSADSRRPLRSSAKVSIAPR